jgi:hypothetical protein
MKKCSICGQDYKGSGNNAKPINDGRCCNDCDELVTARRIVDTGYPFPREAMNTLAAASERMRIVMWIRNLSAEVADAGQPETVIALKAIAEAIEGKRHH